MWIISRLTIYIDQLNGGIDSLKCNQGIFKGLSLHQWLLNDAKMTQSIIDNI